MRILGEIPARPAPALRSGTLRRSDLAAYNRLLEALRGGVVLLAGADAVRRPVAVGLATAAAAAGTRTVLVECDMEEPGLADALGLAAAPGLREYLNGEVKASRILEPITLAGPGSAAALEPLVCIVAGRPAPGARALLHSERFRHAAARLRSGYQLVVLDGPENGEEGAPSSETAGPGALAALAAEADETLACVAPGDPPPALPVSVTGLVVQG